MIGWLRRWFGRKTPVIGHDAEGVPIIRATRRADGYLQFWCFDCRRYHHHLTNGRKLGHCREGKPMHTLGYILVEEVT